MGHTRLTLLVEDLANLAGALSGSPSCPSIELLLTRGTHRLSPDMPANGQRMALFGFPGTEDIPVAALTRLADSGGPVPAGRYWLRVEAVTQQADMTRVFMTGAGLDGLAQQEREGVCRCIEQVLEEEGLEYHEGPDGRWTLELESPPGFSFLPLEEALGLDLADALPAEPEARNWRRIINEAQVALHNDPANTARRQSGQALVNGIWIWGGGVLPEPAEASSFDTVYSAHPVSRGLALLHGCELRSLSSAGPSEFLSGGRVLMDWTVETRDAAAEMDRLEGLVRGLVAPLRRGEVSVDLLGPGGRRWEITRSGMRRFWRRPKSLAELIERNAS